VTRQPEIEVLVTDGNRRPALAVARSLAAQGIGFIVVSDTSHSLTRHSRHVHHWATVPSPAEEPRAFVDELLALVTRHPIRIVMPVLEESLLALDGRRAEVEAQTRLAAAQSNALRQVLDKRINLEIARELGIDVPAQFELRDPAQVPGLIAALGFPMVMKPAGSPYDPAVDTFPFKVLYVRDEAELRRYLRQYCNDGVYPMFQEFIPGEHRNVCCFAARGEVLAMHEHRSRRVLKGQGVLREISPVHPEGERGARAMLGHLQWDGVAQFCSILDERSGRLVYMETNGRFWSSLSGSMNAGWDFPRWMYRYFATGETPAPDAIDLGSRTCWHRGDLVALVNYLAGGENPTPAAPVGKGRAILDYLAGFHPSISADVFRWDDPLPELVDHWQLARRGLDAVFSRGLRDPARLSRPGT
jgi:predicted ATP-grasp superfamily ATP-dependent carboligase